jgi:hypothetical protein
MDDVIGELQKWRIAIGGWTSGRFNRVTMTNWLQKLGRFTQKILGKNKIVPCKDQPVVTEDQLSIHEHYKLFRDYIEHEDGLINKRLLWNINIQGFLFATYGFSLQKLAEIKIPQDGPAIIGVTALQWLICVLPILGIAISVFSFMGVIAAQNAIDQLKADWGQAEKQHVLKIILPGITGGGHSKAHPLGFRAPKWFPGIFILTWLFLFVFYIWRVDFPHPDVPFSQLPSARSWHE